MKEIWLDGEHPKSPFIPLYQRGKPSISPPLYKAETEGILRSAGGKLLGKRKVILRSARRILTLFMLLSMLLACAHETLDETFVSEPYVRGRWLSYLADGKTKREEIIQRLGQPTASYQNDTVLGYRLILIEDGRSLSEKEYRSFFVNVESAYRDRYYGWINDRRKLLSEKGALFTVRDQNKEDKLLEILSREAEYSLVLVFDDQENLVQSSFRKIVP